MFARHFYVIHLRSDEHMNVQKRFMAITPISVMIFHKERATSHFNKYNHLRLFIFVF